MKLQLPLYTHLRFDFAYKVCFFFFLPFNLFLWRERAQYVDQEYYIIFSLFRVLPKALVNPVMDSATIYLFVYLVVICELSALA